MEADTIMQQNGPITVIFLLRNYVLVCNFSDF